jgi:dynein assembly factor with WDR repeat domains 1
VEEIVMEEPIISESRKPQLAALIRSIFRSDCLELIDKIESKKE